MFEMMRIFGLKRDEIIGACRDLCNEELCNLCSSPDICRISMSVRMRWVVHAACTGEAYVQDFGKTT
jgi:hypothetical protein